MRGINPKLQFNDQDEIIAVKGDLMHSNKGVIRKVDVTIGTRVRIVPINKNKLRNRDRVGTVTGFYYLKDYSLRAKVQFDDTKGIGKIPIEELVTY